MKTVFLDECGYTGYDLFNKDQKIFVLASMSINDEEARVLKETYFDDVKSNELKHSRLCKYTKQQNMVINFLKYVRFNPEKFIISVTNKRYAIVCKIVDIIIEPYFYDNGDDLYENGLNIALSNLYYYTIPVFGNEILMEEILEKFQKLVRSKTETNLKEFFEIFYRNSFRKELNDLFEFVRLSVEKYGENILKFIPDNAFDIALTSSIQVMATWRSRISDDIKVIHDASSNMSAQKNIWDEIMDTQMQPQTIGYDYRKMTFPIGVKETSFEKSENHNGLQLVDVIAGATARAVNYLQFNRLPDEYGLKLSEIFKNITVLPLIPEPKVTPEELGTIGTKANDPIIFFTDIMSKIKKV